MSYPEKPLGSTILDTLIDLLTAIGFILVLVIIVYLGILGVIGFNI